MLFTPKEVRNIIGISYRQIQYWDYTDVVKPGFSAYHKHRRYSFPDLVILKFVAVMRQRGYSIQGLRVRARELRKFLVEYTQKISTSLKDLVILWDGKRIILFNSMPIVSGLSRQHVIIDISSLFEQVSNQRQKEDQLRAQAA